MAIFAKIKIINREFLSALIILFLFVSFVFVVYPKYAYAFCDDIKSKRCDSCYCPDPGDASAVAEYCSRCGGVKDLCNVCVEPPPPPGEEPPSFNCGGGGLDAGGQAVCLARDRMNAGATYLLGAPIPSSWSMWDPNTNPPLQFDCSGLTNWSWYWATKGSVNIQGHAPPTMYSKVSSDPFANVDVGDIAYWSGGAAAGHVAMYTGPGTIIEAANPLIGLREGPMYDGSCCSLTFVGWYHPQ